MTTNQMDSLAVNTIRTLSIDAVEKANSGHPGMPMGAAPMAYTLWSQFMDHSPSNPDWFNRDRFVLSAGHGSALLYSMLHLFGYDVSMEDLKSFRQWGSNTPGHPEYGETPGVDATTGPLGQGLAMSVGMAMAERHLAATYNRDDFNVIDHYTYSICGDGDLMEGVSSESASLAAHLKLGRLIVMYDSNDISLDGDLNQSFSEDVQKRYEAYGWQVIRVEDGNDMAAIADALKQAKSNTDQPTMIEVKTTIGYGSPNKGGSNTSHGAPLGADEISLVKENYNWAYENEFHIPEEVKSVFAEIKENGDNKEKQWNELFASYEEKYPELAAELKAAMKGELPEGWDSEIPSYEKGTSTASRAASGEVLNAIAKNNPQIFGGSADLASSNKTMLKDEKDFSAADYSGRNIWFGVREFAMASALNGMALHKGLKVFGATFFVFSDYLRPALRLSALMGVPATYVFTHDSVAVGEDGPTHEPVEQLASLRAMPGLSIIRPADGNETAAAWKVALETSTNPTALVLSRQNLPVVTDSHDQAYEGVKRGAYIVEGSNNADALLLASGSEVGLAVEAKNLLEKEGITASVVSMPSWDLFEKQSEDYKKTVLPDDVTVRLGIEMGASMGWDRYVGHKGDVLAIDRFGASAPGNTVIKEFGFTPENVVKRVKAMLSR
ncbi:transketolase [Guptibacillus algicola]|uniref:transketolase n=1 Tax=Guptibacillus algicola TaxID=225844 RepID=UPI001CD79A28|nr:transketolase [Alkalihalobacillus algicola]MCA0989157.1 transketolase [Alkalihalobacillus algicola]